MVKKAQQPEPAPSFGADHEYWKCLGRFIETFTYAEDHLRVYVAHAAGMEKMMGRAVLVRVKVACRDRRLAIWTSTVYDDKGTVVQSFDNPNPEWQTPIADSFAEAGVLGVCGALRGR